MTESGRKTDLPGDVLPGMSMSNIQDDEVEHSMNN